MKSYYLRKNTERGLTFIETVVGVALFVMIASTLFATYQRVFLTVKNAQSRINATALGNEQLEIIRNLPYVQVGTQTGIPYGLIPAVQTLSRGGMTFVATTTVRNIDNTFDGTASGTPNDLSPADNKYVQIEITCTTCRYFRPLTLYTTVAPKDLEGASTNGSLFIRAIDASGQPVQDADITVFNSSTTPLISLSDVTSTSGLLQIIDAPPALSSYQIAVSKSGYSSERTYGAPTTTNPVFPHATVVAQTVTQLTFSIDRTASLNFSSVTPSCSAVANVGTQVTGAKLISTLPNKYKYDRWFSTGGSGSFSLANMEWDTYTILASSTTYDLAGIMPLSPMSILPNATQNIQLVMVPKASPSVLVSVKDTGTGLPISGATVTLDLAGASTTLTTGRGFLRQTDWSGGSGQDTIGNDTRFFANDAGIDSIISPGNVKLYNTFGLYSTNGTLESSTFDTGSASNFYQFTFLPTSQPAETGVNSPLFQIATGNSTSSWTYLGPDGTAATFYTSTTTDIAPIHNAKRYFRYKMYLSTASTTYTPTISDTMFTFTSSCVPPGQVLFQSLANGTYDLSVTKSGYQDFTGTVTVNAATPWQEAQVTLAP